MKLCLLCNEYFDDVQSICPTDKVALQHVEKDPVIGSMISDRYVIESVIGKGSSAVVYKASRMQRGEFVAVKVFLSYLGADSTSLDRFLREARAASKLRNPHIITIWDTGVTDDGKPYFVMDYLEGLTLSRLIRQRVFLRPSRVLPIVQQIAEALSEAHKQGIVHRDLKPENIVLQETDSGEDYVKILDFGIAESPADSPRLEKPKTVAGSPAYMSPEQCQGFELDHRSDIYSLAIIVFEMLTGVRPFHADEHVSLMFLHVSQAPMKLSDARPELAFPQAVEDVVARALSKNPTDRHSSVKEFAKELETGLRDSGLLASKDKKSTVESLRFDQFAPSLDDRLVDANAGSAIGRGGQVTSEKPAIDLSVAERAKAMAEQDAAAQVIIATASLPPVSLSPGNGGPKMGQTASSESKTIDYNAKDRPAHRDPANSGFSSLRRSTVLSDKQSQPNPPQPESPNPDNDKAAQSTSAAQFERPSPFKGMAKAAQTLVAYNVAGNEHLQDLITEAGKSSASEQKTAAQTPPSTTAAAKGPEAPGTAGGAQSPQVKKPFSITKQDMLAPQKFDNRAPTLYALPEMPLGSALPSRPPSPPKTISANLQKRIQQNVQDSMRSPIEPPHLKSFSLPAALAISQPGAPEPETEEKVDRLRTPHRLENALETAAQLHLSGASPVVSEPAPKAAPENSGSEAKVGLANLLGGSVAQSPPPPQINNFAQDLMPTAPTVVPPASPGSLGAALSKGEVVPTVKAQPTPQGTPQTAQHSPASTENPLPDRGDSQTPANANANATLPALDPKSGNPAEAPAHKPPSQPSPISLSGNLASQTMPPRPGITIHTKESPKPIHEEPVDLPSAKVASEHALPPVNLSEFRRPAGLTASSGNLGSDKSSQILSQNPSDKPLQKLPEKAPELLSEEATDKLPKNPFVQPPKPVDHSPQQSQQMLGESANQSAPPNPSALSELDDAWTRPSPRPRPPASHTDDPILQSNAKSGGQGQDSFNSVGADEADGAGKGNRMPSTFNRLIEAAKKRPKLGDSGTMPPSTEQNSQQPVPSQPMFNSGAGQSTSDTQAAYDRTLSDRLATSSLSPSGAQSLARLNEKGFSDRKQVPSELDSYRSGSRFGKAEQISLSGAHMQAANDMIQELARDATRAHSASSSGSGAGLPAQLQQESVTEVPQASTLPPGFMLAKPAAVPNRKISSAPVEEVDKEPLAEESDDEYLREQYELAVAKSKGQKGKSKANGLADKRNPVAALRMRKGGPSLTNSILIAAVTISLGWVSVKILSRANFIVPKKEIDSSLPRPNRSIKALMDQKDYKQVRKILEKKQQGGNLNKQETDDLETAYVNIAKEDLKAKKYDEANTIIHKIGASSSRSNEANRLLRALKRARKTQVNR